MRGDLVSHRIGIRSDSGLSHDPEALKLEPFRASISSEIYLLRLASDSHSAGRLCTWSQKKDLEKSNFLAGQIGAPFFKNKMPSSYGPGASTVGFMSV